MTTIYDRRDFDSEIAQALKTRQQLQAAFDRIKHSYDTCRIIDAKVALAGADRRLCELRGEKAASKSVEPLRNSSIFFGSNN